MTRSNRGVENETTRHGTMEIIINVESTYTPGLQRHRELT